jgi:uncharacterized membrane protein YqjE
MWKYLVAALHLVRRCVEPTATHAPAKEYLQHSAVLLEHVSMYPQLLAIEWRQETRRLTAIVCALLVMLASALCFLLGAGAWVLLYFWKTPWYLPATGAVLLIYLVMYFLAWAQYAHLCRQASFVQSRLQLRMDMRSLREFIL